MSCVGGVKLVVGLSSVQQCLSAGVPLFFYHHRFKIDGLGEAEERVWQLNM